MNQALKTGMVFEATFTDGERYTFVAAEHQGIGGGWICRVLDRHLKGGAIGCTDDELTDIVSTPDRPGLIARLKAGTFLK